MTSSKRKIPLPGYRFIFITFGILLSLGSIWVFADTFSKDRTGNDYIFGGAWGAIWLSIGIVYIWYSLHLRKENLTKRDWIMGFFVMILGGLTCIGVPVLFMILIWTDSDIRAVFRDRNTA
jgi:hypothetical protein